MKLKYFLFLFFYALSQMAYAKNGIYFLGEGGYAKYGLSSHSPSYSPALRVSVGYNHDWRPCLGLGLELGIGRFGSQVYYSSNRISLRAQTLEFLIAGQIHIQQWDILSKVGGLRETLVYSNQPNQTTINPILGLGFAYNFNCHFAFTTEYIYIIGHTQSKNSNDNPKGPSLKELLAGFRYTF